MNVYDRIVKLCNNGAQGESLNIAFSAIGNLKSISDISEFVEHYKRHYPITWKNDISYSLGFFSYSDRLLWNEAVGKVIGISTLLNRSERELYTQFKYVDKDGKAVPLKYNTEVGNHQSK